MNTLNQLIETGLALEGTLKKSQTISGVFSSNDWIGDYERLANYSQDYLRPILLALRLATEALEYYESLSAMGKWNVVYPSGAQINLSDISEQARDAQAKIQALFPSQTDEKIG